MTGAQKVLAEAKAAVCEAEDAIRRHRFAVSVADGAAPLKALHAFCGTQYRMWQHNMAGGPVSTPRFEDHPYRDVFLVPPEVEENAAREFAALGMKLGMEQAVLDRYEPSARAFAYAAYRA